MYIYIFLFVFMKRQFYTVMLDANVACMYTISKSHTCAAYKVLCS